MRLRILRESDVRALRDQVESGQSNAAYRAGSFSLEGFKLIESVLDPGPEPDLIVQERSGRAATDLDNAIRIFEWIGPLDEVAATDERLWATRCHRFHPYCLARWGPIPEPLDKASRLIVSHWFVKGRGLAALRRNAIARLWWAASLTIAPWERAAAFAPLQHNDRYVFTRALLANQDVYQGLLEREFAIDRRVLLAMLEVIRRDLASRATSAFVTKLAKSANLLAAYRDLGVVGIPELIADFERAAERMSSSGAAGLDV